MLFHRKILVSGIVQGVGFRPFCARLAEKLGLAGSVRNTSGGVEVELTGEPEVLDRYLHALSTENPPASVITSAVVLEDRRAEDSGETAFRILESKRKKSCLCSSRRILLSAMTACQRCGTRPTGDTGILY